MIVELDNLISLQKIDLEIRAIETRLNQIPKEVADLEKEIATERANAASAEARLNESKKTRRLLEGELELVEGRIAKYKDQLMQVKTNVEYKAMQKQVESAKDEVSDKEDKILAMMDETEQLQDELKRRQKELEEGMAEVKKMEAELDAEVARLKEELESKNRRRGELLEAIPEDLTLLYGEISGARSGIAIAEAKDEHCQVCHVRLRPQVYSDLRIGDKIMRCENCTRIMYYVEPDNPPALSRGMAAGAPTLLDAPALINKAFLNVKCSWPRTSRNSRINTQKIERSNPEPCICRMIWIQQVVPGLDVTAPKYRTRHRQHR